MSSPKFRKPPFDAFVAAINSLPAGERVAFWREFYDSAASIHAEMIFGRVRMRLAALPSEGRVAAPPVSEGQA